MYAEAKTMEETLGLVKYFLKKGLTVTINPLPTGGFSVRGK